MHQSVDNTTIPLPNWVELGSNGIAYTWATVLGDEPLETSPLITYDPDGQWWEIPFKSVTSYVWAWLESITVAIDHGYRHWDPQTRSQFLTVWWRDRELLRGGRFRFPEAVLDDIAQALAVIRDADAVAPDPPKWVSGEVRMPHWGMFESPPPAWGEALGIEQPYP